MSIIDPEQKKRFEANLALALKLARKGAKVVPGRAQEEAVGWSATRLDSFDDPWDVGAKFNNHDHQKELVPMICGDNGIWEIAPGSLMSNGTRFGPAPVEYTVEQQTVLLKGLAALAKGVARDVVLKALRAAGIANPEI